MAGVTSKATRDGFGERLAQLGETEPRIVVIDGDLGGSTRTTAFMKKFPQRHFEVGIAEQNMVGVAAGLAMGGKISVATSFACFLTGRLEVIRVAVCYNDTNVKLVGTHAGIGIGDDGPSQMALEDVAAMRALPNMTVLQPADTVETKQAVDWMIKRTGPVYLRLTRQNMEEIHPADYKFQFGKIDRVFSVEANARLQATIFASGGVVANAIKAAQELEKRGFRAQVYNVHTIKPLDVEGVAQAVAASQRVVTAEDHFETGGLGSAIAEAMARYGCPAPLVRLGLRDFAESGTTEELYSKYGLSAEHIVEACLRNIE